MTLLRDIEFAVYQGSNHLAQRLSYATDRRLAKPNRCRC